MGHATQQDRAPSQHCCRCLVVGICVPFSVLVFGFVVLYIWRCMHTSNLPPAKQVSSWLVGSIVPQVYTACLVHSTFGTVLEILGVSNAFLYRVKVAAVCGHSRCRWAIYSLRQECPVPLVLVFAHCALRHGRLKFAQQVYRAVAGILLLRWCWALSSLVWGRARWGVGKLTASRTSLYGQSC